ncbi:hypothetical protein CNMCM5793_004353 [Aspergillus hiratsukae]|uniref:Cytochrome c oxidase assembly factor 3 n=1 Tax=Aspergillus hiratsukae TaxID=1194566 RepID=A0A8H6P3S6_9EURO|nr:hypothetical protein CNMCM5793_004353 [Aspergillus hiratsukae]KAF7161755.1 hypothetical protein CNMCM6106_008908 [Aspergillus hiratsukae]
MSADQPSLSSFNSTYYGKDGAGAALLRARRPYLFRNALTGLGLVAFTISVCTYSSGPPLLDVSVQNARREALFAHTRRNFLDAYTIRAVGQDEFSDVKVPDTPAQQKQ